MPKVDVIEVQGVVQTGGKPGAGMVTLDTLGADTLALISGGSGATTIADGADVTQGAVADAAWSGTGNTTVVGALKGIWGRVNAAAAALGAIGDAAWTSGNGTLVAVLKAIAGSNSTVAGAVTSSRMNSNIQRTGASGSTSISSAVTDSLAIDISGWIAGGFITPATMTGSSITYKASQTTSGHVPLYDQYGNLVTTPISTSQSRAYPFPQEAAGYASLILVSSAAEGAARTINTFKKG